MQNWVVVNEEYLNFLRKSEARIPYSNYEIDKYKPFFGILFEVDDLVYVTQISHAQPRHLKMKNSLDFIKIFLPDTIHKNDRLVAVVNLNYMFPVPKSLIEILQYKNIENYRIFTSQKEKSQYIDLLTKELKQINNLHIEEKAKKLYNIKKEYPFNKIAQRCVDFTKLETLAKTYIEI